MMEMWESGAGSRVQETVMIYGKEETASFLSCDLLWGIKHYQMLRFVVASIGNAKPIILATNDLNLAPLQIIRLYSYRFKIECAFFQLKHIIAGFAHRFWSVAMPKLNRFAPSGCDPLEAIDIENDRGLILGAYRATQVYVTVACIALGLLQICSLKFAPEINASPLRRIRTRSNPIPSEASTADFLRKIIFKLFGLSSNLYIIRIIKSFQFCSDDSNQAEAA